MLLQIQCQKNLELPINFTNVYWNSCNSKTVICSQSTLWKEQVLTDFEIVCESKSFKCHKVVLACCSGEFSIEAIFINKTFCDS